MNYESAMQYTKKLEMDNEKMRNALNKIGILQMGELDYTKDFFEQTKMIVRETLKSLEIK